MRFEHPYLLWLLPVVVGGLLLFFWWAWRTKREFVRQFVAARLIDDLTVGFSTGRRKVRIGMLVSAAALLVLVVARPQIGFSYEEARSRGLDIVVAIDTSRSMLATDVTPTRLRRAQLAALDLKRLARTDRLGLVAFAGSAFLQCPLTLDDEAFRQSVEALDVQIIPQGGTALKEAIQAAKAAFKKDNDNHRVLVFFTDGEDHDGDAQQAAAAAGEDGLRIFTIGVGTANGEVLRTTDAQGRTVYIKDAQNNAVRSRLNESLLREMAQDTGGFYMLLSGANTMNLLYERGLAPLPKGELSSSQVKRHHERYQWLLGIVLVLLFLEMVLPERPTEKKRLVHASSARASGGVGAKTLSVLLLFLVPLATQGSPRKARKEYEAGKYDKAQMQYERSLESHPDDPRLHFNAGAAAFRNRDYEQARSHLQSALITQDLELQQRAYYNMGNTDYRGGEQESDPQKKIGLWEQALKHYESAIKLDPDDRDATFNSELVKLKLEQLKQQQQQKQDGDKDQDQDKDKEGEEEQQEEQKQEGDESGKDGSEEEQQEEQQQDGEENKQEQEQSSSSEGQKDGEEEQGRDGSAQQQGDSQEEEQKAGQAQQGGAQAVRMTPQEAVRLLESMKAEEKVLPFRPVTKPREGRRVLKDW